MPGFAYVEGCGYQGGDGAGEGARGETVDEGRAVVGVAAAAAAGTGVGPIWVRDFASAAVASVG